VTGQGLRPLLLPDGFEGTPLRKSFVLASRASKAWPGAKEPGEGAEGNEKSNGAKSAPAAPEKPGRRKIQAPGVPDITWGPR
jgi:NADH-quinone oxidoreductase subunit C